MYFLSFFLYHQLTGHFYQSIKYPATKPPMSILVKTLNSRTSLNIKITSYTCCGPTPAPNPWTCLTAYLSSEASSSSPPCQESVMGYCWQSWMAKSRTRNVGDRMAHCRAQPLATASSAFRVVLASFPNTLITSSLILGIRLPPPMISTA